MHGASPAVRPAAVGSGTPDYAQFGVPAPLADSSGGSDGGAATAPMPLPTRRDLLHRPPAQDVTVPAVRYCLIVTDGTGQTEVLTGWDTVQEAQDAASILHSIAGYLVAPMRQVAGP